MEEGGCLVGFEGVEGRGDGGEGDVGGPFGIGGGFGVLEFQALEGHAAGVRVGVVDGVKDDAIGQGLEEGGGGWLGVGGGVELWWGLGDGGWVGEHGVHGGEELFGMVVVVGTGVVGWWAA